MWPLYDSDMVPTIGTVTIGQTPRGDIVPELHAELRAEIQIEQVGVLDGLSREVIAERSGRLRRRRVVTRLRSGEEVHVHRDFVAKRFSNLVAQLDGGVAMILVLCTGDLPQVRTTVPILYPGLILRNVAESLRVDRLGVLTPGIGQVRAQRRRWRGVAGRVFVADASPYGAPEALAKAAQRLERKHPEIVVMDCIGYTKAMRQDIRDRLNVPVLSALSLLGRVADELIGDPRSDLGASVTSLS